MENLTTFKDFQTVVSNLNTNHASLDFSAIIIAAPNEEPGYLTTGLIKPEHTAVFFQHLCRAIDNTPAMYSLLKRAIGAVDSHRAATAADAGGGK